MQLSPLSSVIKISSLAAKLLRLPSAFEVSYFRTRKRHLDRGGDDRPKAEGEGKGWAADWEEAQMGFFPLQSSFAIELLTQGWKMP